MLTAVSHPTKFFRKVTLFDAQIATNATTATITNCLMDIAQTLPHLSKENQKKQGRAQLQRGFALCDFSRLSLVRKYTKSAQSNSLLRKYRRAR